MQYKPLTKQQRQQITEAMKAYGEFVEKRQSGLDGLLPQDPRDESEKCAAEELDAKVSIYCCCRTRLFPLLLLCYETT